jgi:hypothetical protein
MNVMSRAQMIGDWTRKPMTLALPSPKLRQKMSQWFHKKTDYIDTA